MPSAYGTTACPTFPTQTPTDGSGVSRTNNKAIRPSMLLRRNAATRCRGGVTRGEAQAFDRSRRGGDPRWGRDWSGAGAWIRWHEVKQWQVAARHGEDRQDNADGKQEDVGHAWLRRPSPRQSRRAWHTHLGRAGRVGGETRRDAIQGERATGRRALWLGAALSATACG